MGVRGKIEAVIYAAEEPVTLQQLAALFGVEALAEQGEQEAARETVAEGEPAQEQGADEAPAFPTDSELDDQANASGRSEAPASPRALPVEGSGQEAEAQPETVASEPYQASGVPVLVGDPDGDKRAARLRDRRAREAVEVILSELVTEYDRNDRGMEIREIAGGYRVATKPEYHDAVRAFAKSLKAPMKLSLQALETLAVIAYKQPVTAPEVSEIRGVDSGGVMGSLIGRKLVTTAGRKQVVGRPILYKTTREFLLRFGLKDLAELPSMEEFEKLAGELEGMAAEPAAPAAGEPPTDTAASEDAGERPSLAPTQISMDVEDLESPGGISINRSGVPIPDTADETQKERAGE